MQSWNDFLQLSWNIGTWEIGITQLLSASIVILIAFILTQFASTYIFKFLIRKDLIEETTQKKLRRTINIIIYLVASILVLRVLHLDYTLFFKEVDLGGLEPRPIIIVISTFLVIGIIIQVARLLDYCSRIFLIKYENKLAPQQGKTLESQPQNQHIRVSQTIRYLVYIVAAIFIFNWTNLDFGLTIQNKQLSITSILHAITTLLIAWVIIWVVTHFILQSYYRTKNIDVGNQFAINQLVKYVVYVFAILIALQSNLHYDLGILLGGAAALLVGVGLGMQHIFNDLISGILLLFEKTVEVGDVVEVDGMIGRITQIGLRTSTILILDNTTVVVPNSKFVTDSVKNWTHNEDEKVRFHLAVGVAYGSDTKAVKAVLLRAAEDNPDILQRPAPFVRFVDFADSSLNFELHFWSRNLVNIWDVKSDLRFEIDAEFRKQNIEIPFPQMVIWKGKENNA